MCDGDDARISRTIDESLHVAETLCSRRRPLKAFLVLTSSLARCHGGLLGCAKVGNPNGGWASISSGLVLPVTLRQEECLLRVRAAECLLLNDPAVLCTASQPRPSNGPHLQRLSRSAIKQRWELALTVLAPCFPAGSGGGRASAGVWSDAMGDLSGASNVSALNLRPAIFHVSAVAAVVWPRHAFHILSSSTPMDFGPSNEVRRIPLAVAIKAHLLLASIHRLKHKHRRALDKLLDAQRLVAEVFGGGPGSDAIQISVRQLVRELQLRHFPSSSPSASHAEELRSFWEQLHAHLHDLILMEKQRCELLLRVELCSTYYGMAMSSTTWMDSHKVRRLGVAGGPSTSASAYDAQRIHKELLHCVSELYTLSSIRFDDKPMKGDGIDTLRTVVHPSLLIYCLPVPPTKDGASIHPLQILSTEVMLEVLRHYHCIAILMHLNCSTHSMMSLRASVPPREGQPLNPTATYCGLLKELHECISDGLGGNQTSPGKSAALLDRLCIEAFQSPGHSMAGTSPHEHQIRDEFSDCTRSLKRPRQEGDCVDASSARLSPVVCRIIHLYLDLLHQQRGLTPCSQSSSFGSGSVKEEVSEVPKTLSPLPVASQLLRSVDAAMVALGDEFDRRTQRDELCPRSAALCATAPSQMKFLVQIKASSLVSMAALALTQLRVGEAIDYVKELQKCLRLFHRHTEFLVPDFHMITACVGMYTHFRDLPECSSHTTSSTKTSSTDGLGKQHQASMVLTDDMRSELSVDVGIPFLHLEAAAAWTRSGLLVPAWKVTLIRLLQTLAVHQVASGGGCVASFMPRSTATESAECSSGALHFRPLSTAAQVRCSTALPVLLHSLEARCGGEISPGLPGWTPVMQAVLHLLRGMKALSEDRDEPTSMRCLRSSAYMAKRQLAMLHPFVSDALHLLATASGQFNGHASVGDESSSTPTALAVARQVAQRSANHTAIFHVEAQEEEEELLQPRASTPKRAAEGGCASAHGMWEEEMEQLCSQGSTTKDLIQVLQFLPGSADYPSRCDDV